MFTGVVFVSITISKMNNLGMMLPAGLAGFKNDELFGYSISTCVHFWCIILTTNTLVGFCGFWIYFILTTCACIEIVCDRLTRIGKNDLNKGIPKCTSFI